uniref:Uncharacterized protein n=1 Tax=Romanomermis culicivorax TaxID=13658 RepID=A0A915IW29_ROMCU
MHRMMCPKFHPFCDTKSGVQRPAIIKTQHYNGLFRSIFLTWVLKFFKPEAALLVFPWQEPGYYQTILP